MFGLLSLVLVVALFGLIGAIRNPPDDDRSGEPSRLDPGMRPAALSRRERT